MGSGSHQLPGGLWRKELEQEKAEEAPGAATFTEGLELKPASYGQGLPMGSGTHLLPGDKTGNSPGAGLGGGGLLLFWKDRGPDPVYALLSGSHLNTDLPLGG